MLRTTIGLSAAASIATLLTIAQASTIGLTETYFKAKRAIIIESGSSLKIKPSDSKDASQCFIHNKSEKSIRLEPALKIGAVSWQGSPSGKTIHDWQFTSLPHSLITIHCEFPRGVSDSKVFEEASHVLKHHVRLVQPAKAQIASLSQR